MPAAPTTTAPAAEPAPVKDTEQMTDPGLSDIYSEIENLDDSKSPKWEGVIPPKGSKVEPPKKVEKPKVEEPQEEPEPEEEPEKTVEEPEEKQEELPKRTRDLKTVYLDLKKKHAEAEKRLAEREAKIKELEQRNPEEASVLMSRLEAAEKRAKALDDEIRYVNYTKSEEFREKYQKPYESAWAKAVAEIGELTIETEQGTRAATAHDLLQISNLPLGEARKMAKELFGDAADDVMAHRRTIRELSDAQNKALEEAQKNAGERERLKGIEAQASQANRAKAWQSANKFLEEKFPKAFKVDPTDPEDKSSFVRGFALADLLYQGPQQLTPEQVDALPDMFKDAVRLQRPLSESEMVKLHALARLKMANEPRLAARLKKATAKIAQLEKDLKAYQASEPPGGKGGKTAGKGNGTWIDDANAEIDALDTGR